MLFTIVCRRRSIPRRILTEQKWDEADSGELGARGVLQGPANGLDERTRVDIEKRVAEVDDEYKLEDEIISHQSPGHVRMGLHLCMSSRHLGCCLD
jgi:hypothetical protein